MRILLGSSEVFSGVRGKPLVFMFNNRNYNRTFFNAPQSVTSFVAAFLEPSITVASLLAALAYFEEPVQRASMALCLLVFIVWWTMFSGRRKGERAGTRDEGAAAPEDRP